MKRTISMLLTIGMVVTLMLSVTMPASAADDGMVVTGSGTFTVEEAVERALAYEECQNLAGKHEFYHTALEHRAELDNIWVNEEPWTDTMSWTNNTQFCYGKENVYGFYCGVEDEVVNWTRSAAAMDDTGTITESEEWYGTGILWYHMLMSPVIEVARDGQTACGLWQSWGTVTQPAGGGMGAQWTCEDYTTVFAKMSTGEWKIWHLRTFVHFYTNVDNHWYEQNMATQGNGGEDVPAGVGVMADGAKPEGMPVDMGDMPPPADMTPPGGNMAPPSGLPEGSDTYAEIGEWYVGYDLYRVPKLITIPEPYDTWADIEDTFYWGNQPVYE